MGGYFILFDITEKGHSVLNTVDFFRCKGEDDFTPVGKFINPSEIPNPYDISI